MSDINPGQKEPKRKITIIVINSLLSVLIIIAIIWGITTYFNLDTVAYTDDAQVEEYINPINVRIPGYVKDVKFNDHQHVKKGDTLVTIDDREYVIALEQAEASYLSALAAKTVASSSTITAQSNIAITNADIQASKARLWNAEQNFHRYQNLLRDGAATQQQFDQVKTEYDALSNQTDALIKQRTTTNLTTNELRKRVDVNDAEIKRAKAAVDLAKLNLSYTILTAPYDGVTGRRNIQEEQLVQAGQTLFYFVRNNDKWVVANYRETQIAKLKIGQKVKLKVDGFSDKPMIGRIVAISAATGSRYSAIPMDNSTGNFVKVQQRIPVKIAVSGQDNKQADIDELKAGMNVEVELLNKN